MRSALRCSGRHAGVWLSAVAILLAAQGASAASFVSSSRVIPDGQAATVEINFNCQVVYVQHEPAERSDRVRIYLESTAICNGVAPSVVQSRSRYRPAGADDARLVDLEFDGEDPAGAVVTLNFSEPVNFSIDAPAAAFLLRVVVQADEVATSTSASDAKEPVLVKHRRVVPEPEPAQKFVINLTSYRRAPTVADVPQLDLQPGQRLFYSEIAASDATWYRLALGDFDSAADAEAALKRLNAQVPGAWVGVYEAGLETVDLTDAARDTVAGVNAEADQGVDQGEQKIDVLMAEARQLMVSGEISRAIQIYTKVLRPPENSRQMEAQELLAVAREKNGQLAHAKAEYERYLALYSDTDGAARVQQRLAALLAVGRQSAPAASATASGTRRQSSAWRIQTFFSQYYRRDVNQQNEQDEIVSQSALYSDVNVDARRRGKRFDFSSRLSAGYRNDFLDTGSGQDNDTRISYAYADLSDAETGLRGRLGRQSRNSGGVLGRFDGFNLGYQINERVLASAVVGKPAYSSTDGVDSARTFYGTSVNYGPLWDGLELGLFFVQQDIEGIVDRQAIGGEFRYFGENQSLWGLLDYDTSYSELGSAFVQGTWRFSPHFSVHGSLDRRRSPFLSAGNALIGQPVFEFEELLDIFAEDEIRQLGLDRSPVSSTYSVGFAYSMTPKLQLNMDANETTVEATPDSGGVFGMPESSYRYFSTNIVASSLMKEGDVSILGLRYSDSDTATVLSVMVDTRVPFGRRWRVNPRLRVDRRDRITDSDYEWIYTPGIRLQYRRSQGLRIELEAGRQFVQREAVDLDLDRESYFVNLGYQLFF